MPDDEWRLNLQPIHEFHSRRSAKIGGVVIGVAIVGTCVGIGLWSSSHGTPSSGQGHSTSTRSVASPETSSTTQAESDEQSVIKGKKPKGAKACDTRYDVGGTPRHSAVQARTTTCGFAEEARRAYAQSGQLGQELTLTSVYSPKLDKYFDLECSGDHLVTCVGGVDATVYLY